MSNNKPIQNMPVLIFIPAYNVAPYIQASIDSALAQTYKNFKLLIINDGSTDETLSIVKKNLDPRVMVIDQANLGVSVTANKAIQFAKEENYPYLMRLDADDIAMPDRLEVQIRLLEAMPKAALCSSNCIYIDEGGINQIGTATVSTSPQLIRWELLHGFRGLIQPSVTFRTHALADVGGYRAEFPTAEDVDLFLRLTEKHKAINSPQYLTKIRLRSNSLSLGDNQSNIKYHYYARSCARRRKKGLPEHTFVEHQEKIGLLGKIYIWREIQLLKFWRKNMVTNNKVYLLLSMILDPRRFFVRILRLIEIFLTKIKILS